jgi:hypothetical protein
MADAQTPEKKEEAAIPREPAGPGLMIVAGLALLIVAIWCGKDFFFPAEDWIKEGKTFNIWFNGGGMTFSVLLSAYCFFQAIMRNRRAAKPNAQKPDDPNLL